MRKKRLCTVLIFIFFSGFIKAYGHADKELLFKYVEVKNGSSLSVADCVAVAFKNSPKIKRKKYNLDIANSNAGIAKSQYFPVISAGIGFLNENNSDNIYYNSRYRELPSVGISINKLIWNFGKTTAYIKMEEFYKLGAEYEFIDSLCATIFDIKEKYYSMLKAKALEEVSRYNVELNEDFVKLSKTKKKYDQTTADLNLSEAKVQYIEARNDYANAKVDLSNSMYLAEQPDFEIKPTPTFDYNGTVAYAPEKITTQTIPEKEFPFTRDNAAEIAYENSPDLSVLVATKNAMEQSLLYIKRTYLPDLTANASYGFNNSTQTTNNSFQVGVNLTSSVNLMELKHNIKGADAQLHLADNEITLFKKDLYFELKRALNNYDRAEKQIPASKLEVVQAFENLNTVKEQYKKDELNYVALQDARKDYINALNRYVESLYNYNMSLIQIEMATHLHLADIHHKSEHAMHYHFKELIKDLNKALGCDEHETKHHKSKSDEEL